MKIFIGSSKEQQDVVNEVAEWLEEMECEPLPWTDNEVFPLGVYSFDALLRVCSIVDAAIFIFGEDDKIWFRNETTLSVRDNVLLEYGLFSGKLPSGNVIFMCKGRPKIATDLTGITYAYLDKKRNAKQRLELWVEHLRDKQKQQISGEQEEGIFKIVNLYDAFNIVFRDVRQFETFRVFAISTFKSVQMLRLINDLKINKAEVLLRKYEENDWFYEESMKNAINNAVKNWQKMVEKNNILKLDIAYFNYHPDEGFYIFDDRYLVIGCLNFDKNEQKSEFADDVMLIDNKTDVGKRWINAYISRFQKIAENYEHEIFNP